MAATRLQATREQLGYKASRVIELLIQLGRARNIPVMSATSLKTKLSNWENGRAAVSAPYRQLFREIYGRTNEELGFPPEPEDDDTNELRSRIAVARTVDSDLLDAFRRQVDDTRRIDRQHGAVAALDQLRGSIKHIADLLSHTTMGGHREQLASVLTQASTLAGWEALDRNALAQAWDHYERAKSAAREANSPELLTYSIAEQAFVLLELDEPAHAVDQLTQARELAEHAVPPLLRAWLAAAHGEGLAAIGDRDNALRAYDTANTLLPANPTDPALPFVFLGGSHLNRWRGNALARLGETEAIDQLHDALEQSPASFVRARVGLLVDLSCAYAAADDRDAAHQYSRQARQLALQIKSDRQLRRLSKLTLPGCNVETP